MAYYVLIAQYMFIEQYKSIDGHTMLNVLLTLFFTLLQSDL